MSSQTHAPTGSLDEQGNHCFACGPENPHGLHLHFTFHADDAAAITATTTASLTPLHEGPPGYVHGGIIATLLDEAMSKLNRPLNLIAMTRHMEVDYLRPVPLHTPLTVTGRHLRREGRKLFHTAEIAGPDAKVLARAKGVFVVIDPALLARVETH